MKLQHERYCSTEHKEAYFHAMDRIGLEHLTAARPRITSYEPCTKAVDLGVQPQPVQAPVKFAAPRIRPHLELGQGEAVAVAGI